MKHQLKGVLSLWKNDWLFLLWHVFWVQCLVVLLLLFMVNTLWPNGEYWWSLVVLKDFAQLFVLTFHFVFLHLCEWCPLSCFLQVLLWLNRNDMLFSVLLLWDSVFVCCCCSLDRVCTAWFLLCRSGCWSQTLQTLDWQHLIGTLAVFTFSQSPIFSKATSPSKAKSTPSKLRQALIRPLEPFVFSFLEWEKHKSCFRQTSCLGLLQAKWLITETHRRPSNHQKGPRVILQTKNSPNNRSQMWWTLPKTTCNNNKFPNKNAQNVQNKHNNVQQMWGYFCSQKAVHPAKQNLKETQISSNDQRKKKSGFFLHLWLGENNILLLFWHRNILKNKKRGSAVLNGLPQNWSMFDIANTIQHHQNQTSWKSTLSCFSKNLAKGDFVSFSKIKKLLPSSLNNEAKLPGSKQVQNNQRLLFKMWTVILQNSTKTWPRKLENGVHRFEHHHPDNISETMGEQ